MRTVTRYDLSDELPVLPVLPVLPIDVLPVVLPWRGTTSMRVTTLLDVPLVVIVGPAPVMVPVVELDVSWPAVLPVMLLALLGVAVALVSPVVLPVLLVLAVLPVPVLLVLPMPLVPLVPAVPLLPLTLLLPVLPDGEVAPVLL